MAFRESILDRKIEDLSELIWLLFVTSAQELGPGGFHDCENVGEAALDGTGQGATPAQPLYHDEP